MYTDKNYKTKKEFINDLKAGVHIGTFQPGGFFPATLDGPAVIEGPHYPQPHKWYASVILSGGYVKSAK